MANLDPSQSSESAIPAETLVMYALGELDPAAAGVVEARLAADPLAWAALERVWSTLMILREDDTVDAPRGAVERAKGLLGAGVTAGLFERSAAAARRVLASLVFDSAATPTLAGFRGELVERQLAYSTELAEIDLRLSRARGANGAPMCEVRGQIDRQGGDASAIRIALVPTSGGTFSETVTEADGGFRLAAPEEPFDLMILIDDAIITLPGLRA